jgi:hypothetical protein
MRTVLIAILMLIVGVTLGAVGASLALRDDPAALVRTPTDPATKRWVRQVETAAFLAEAESAEVPAALRQFANGVRRLDEREVPTQLVAATNDLATAADALADQIDVADTATSGWRGAARGSWQAIRSLAGDEQGGPPNRVALRSASADLTAAAAAFTAAAEASGVAVQGDNLPGLPAEE